MTSPSQDPEVPAVEGWVILELMGHRRLAGRLSEARIAGSSFLRIDVPAAGDDGDAVAATQFYAPSAVYCVTPCDEGTARRVAGRSQPAPVSRWELTAAGEDRGEGAWV